MVLFGSSFVAVEETLLEICAGGGLISVLFLGMLSVSGEKPLNYHIGRYTAERILIFVLHVVFHPQTGLEANQHFWQKWFCNFSSSFFVCCGTV